MRTRARTAGRPVTAYMSQMVKKCTFQPDGTVTGRIEELVSRKGSMDPNETERLFMSDVERELLDSGLRPPLASGLLVGIERGDYVKYTYRFKEPAGEWKHESLKTHEWVVNDRT